MMRTQRKILYLASVVLLSMVLVLCVITDEQNCRIPLSFVVEAGENREEITLWQAETGEYYVFLPSYANLSQVRIQTNTDRIITIDGIPLQDNTGCACYQLDVPYEITCTAWGKSQRSTITFLKSSNVATMYINTQSGSMDFIHEEKGNKESGFMALYLPDGSEDYIGKLESIQGRGNFTWISYDKKAYSLRLPVEANLLNMGEAQKWVLLANAGDATNLRNKIVYDFAKDAGLPYSPDSDWVDVYLNGEYVGIYLLSERNEVHKNRVAITERESFLVSQEIESKMQSQGIPFLTTDAGLAFRLHYPDAMDAAALESIQHMLQSVENAILTENGIDPLTGKHWSELIDLDSWARKFLIEEMFGNGDAGAISQFFYVDGSDDERKLFAGPVWDYDRTMGNSVAWQLLSPHAFFANRIQVNGEYSTFWLTTLYKNEAFSRRVQELYQNEFLPLMEQYLREDIVLYRDHIQASAVMNDVRWFASEEYSQGETEKLVDYMYARNAFLWDTWVDEKPYYCVQADQGFGANYANYIVFAGEALTDLYMFEDTPYSHFVGWYDKQTDEPFDIAAPVTRDMQIYAKWEALPSGRMDEVMKLIPLAVITAMGIALLWVEIRRIKKSR